MAIKTSSQSLISRGSTTTAISGFGGGTSSGGGSSTITSISYLAANGVALTANAAPTVSNSLIKIVGTGFTSGANVYLNGLLQPSANVTFVNSTELRLNMPPLTTNTYSLMTFDSTGAGAVYYPGVRFDPYPLWGNTVFNATTAVSQQLTVTDYGSGSVTFSLASGNTLPSGLTLSANGLMSGTIAGGTYTFYVNAIDSENEISPQQVTLIAVTNITAEYLIVGGGGSGGSYISAGGGAGGYRTNYGSTPITLAPSTAYTVTVGSGGTGVNSGASSTPHRNPGVASSLIGGAISIESAGGGGGGGWANILNRTQNPGQDGGSGGGSNGSYSNGNPYVGGLGNTPSVSPSQGNDGGTSGGGNGYAGGGGGAGTAGGAPVYNNRAGNGGSGLSNSITGTSVMYAGGGGAGGSPQSNPSTSPGTGGSGGGGNGGTGYGVNSGNGYDGTVNTGGGGGGGGPNTTSPDGRGGNGGSGIVILRTTNAAVSTTGSPTVTTDAGYNVYQFTASGTITF